MFLFTASNIMTLVVIFLAVAGFICFVSGFLLLLRQSTGKAVETLASQTASLASKGIAEDVAGLIGNAKGLIESLNDLVRTSAGIGIFYMVFGFIMLLVAFFLSKQMS
jgi:hypothetical protein